MKTRLTKGELKRQRDALRQYQRYLPTLQLKKQQLQMEILRQSVLLNERLHTETIKRRAIELWSGLLLDVGVNIKKWLKIERAIIIEKNIAGVNVPIFERAEFFAAEYDLFTTPLWVDSGLEALKELVSLREELKVIQHGIEILRQELRVTAQRVNLFEKVKIPEAEEAIRLIKIYIGDQMANAVGRSKIAKRKIEVMQLEGAAA